MSTPVKWVDPTLVLDPTSCEPVLAGARCTACATTVFPFQQGCPKCGGATMARIGLPTVGRLWSYTVQYFQPKPPYRGTEPFEPFGLGYVDLGDICVESRLTVNDPSLLDIGMNLKIVTVTAFLDSGEPVLTFAFAPEGDRA